MAARRRLTGPGRERPAPGRGRRTPGAASRAEARNRARSPSAALSRSALPRTSSRARWNAEGGEKEVARVVARRKLLIKVERELRVVGGEGALVRGGHLRRRIARERGLHDGEAGAGVRGRPAAGRGEQRRH